MTGEASTFRLRVAAIGEEATGVRSLVLVDPDGGDLPSWQSGAHIDLHAGPDLVRQYSLCGDPGDLGSWRVAVLLEPEGRGGSRWVHTEVTVGDVVTVEGPRNNFPLVDADSYLFIAGGIGITPLLPMVEELAGRGAEWELLYGGRRKSSMAFVDRLAVHCGRVVLAPEDEHGLLDLAGLLGEPRPGAAIYCCGPEPLIVAVEAASEHWPGRSLNVERFSARPGALEGENHAFEVVLDSTGQTIAVGADQSIVEALDAAGVEVPTSCREGTCGTCETEVLEGEVDHRDSFLNQEERELGTMMICCSRAKNKRLVLDL